MDSTVNTLSVGEQIQQLNEARKLVLENAAYYQKIVQGILPIIGPSSPVELRRWGADFLAESLATPTMAVSEKETLAVAVLGTLKDLVDSQNEDTLVLKSSVIAAASAYPLVLRWTVSNAENAEKNVAESWQHMVAIKSRILRVWDSAVTPVKICCIKFAQRVVLAQTLSTSSSDYKHNGLDVSLAMIPSEHSLLDKRLLEAEATGLLDRMLGILQENSSDALLVDATLNSLSILVRTRPSTSNRVINALLNFNPLKLANSPITSKTKVLIKSMEKTTRLLLYHLAKRDPSNLAAPRLQQQAERLARSRAEILDEAGRKRGLAEQAAMNYAEAKRQKLEAANNVIRRQEVKPMGPGPHTLASVFTLADNPDLAAFDVKQVPPAYAVRISIAALMNVDVDVLEHALNGVRDRLTKLNEAASPAPINAETAPLGVEDDDDDYEPDFSVAEDNEQILNKLDSAPPTETPVPVDDALSALAPLGPFKLPSPPQLDPQSALKVGQVMAARIFEPLSTFEDPVARKTNAGMNRLAANTYDRDAWVTLISRLATRSGVGLEDASSSIKGEDTSSGLDSSSASVSDFIRERLHNHILEDFRRRIDTAVSWLCEEWYNDQLTKKVMVDAPLHYEKWALRLVDGFLDYLTPQDKVLTRFLSELPELSRDMFNRIKALCSDPTRVNLALTSLLYLVMTKPPVKELALDTVAEIWQEVETARPLAAKYLVKYRPGFVESQKALQESESKAPPAVAT